MNVEQSHLTRQQEGLTLVELLVSIAILAILLGAFTQIFSSSLRASGEVNARNELLNEGQIAQQIVASRLQNAYYIYTGAPGDPNPMRFTSSGATTRNTVGGSGQNWRYGTDPFVAMLVPPERAGVCANTTAGRDSCFTFYAYYPMLRSALIAGAPDSSPPADPNNADVWVLMEYRANMVDFVDRSADILASPPLPGTPFGNAFFGDRRGQMLVDYVQPLGDAPYARMFEISAADKFVDFHLQMLQNFRAKRIVAAGEAGPLTTRVYPRNWF